MVRLTTGSDGHRPVAGRPASALESLRGVCRWRPLISPGSPGGGGVSPGLSPLTGPRRGPQSRSQATQGSGWTVPQCSAFFLRYWLNGHDRCELPHAGAARSHRRLAPKVCCGGVPGREVQGDPLLDLEPQVAVKSLCLCLQVRELLLDCVALLAKISSTPLDVSRSSVIRRHLLWVSLPPAPTVFAVARSTPSIHGSAHGEGVVALRTEPLHD